MMFGLYESANMAVNHPNAYNPVKSYISKCRGGTSGTLGGCHDFLDHWSGIISRTKISRSACMGGTRVVQEWEGCNDFLHHHRRRCAPISSAQPAMRGTPATPQFRQHNVLAFSIHLHLTFQHSIVRICSQQNATARIVENEMLCWRNSFSTHLHLTFQQIVRNFSQHNEWNWTDSDCGV